MQRKLIKQGPGHSVTVYLPKKWIDDQGLKAGDFVDIVKDQQDLLVRAKERKYEKKELSAKIKDSRESAVRAIVVNAYRAGIDVLRLEYDGDPYHITRLLEKALIGYEITDRKENKFIIEIMSEPRYEDAQKLVDRQFHLLSQVLREMPSDIMIYVHQLQRYENFIKRGISKGIFYHEASYFLWHFLSDMTHIARLCLHLSRYVQSKQLSKEENELKKQAIEMFDFLKDVYFKKDLTILRKVHEKEQELVRDKGKDYLKRGDPYVIHQLLQIAKLIYLSNSPLTGYLHLNRS